MRNNRHIPFIEYFKAFNSFLFIILGGVIILHSLFSVPTVPAVLAGGSFLGFGIYRIRFVIRYIKGLRT